MHQSINKKKIYFYLLALVFLSTFFNSKINSKIENFKLITEIKIQGLSGIEKNYLNKKLEIYINKNIFKLDRKKIIESLNVFNFLEYYYVKKIFPSQLTIFAKKTNFVGLTIKDSKSFYIGENGKMTLVSKVKKEKNLPFVFGKFPVNEFLKLQNILKLEKIDLTEINKYFYHQSKRWDFQNDQGVLIMLPSNNIKSALKVYKSLISNKKFNSSKIIDLRLSERVILTNE